MKSIRKNFLRPFLFVCFGLMIAAFAIASNPREEPSKPGKPEVVDAGAGWCELRYTAPVSDGGSPVTGYVIERRYKGGPWEKVLEVSASDLDCVVMCIEKQEVQFRIRAVNRAGLSEPSEPTDSMYFKNPLL